MILDFFFPLSSKRLDYINHARRLAEDDWTYTEEEEEKEKKGEEKERETAKADGDHEDMELDIVKKLPKRYANQVSRRKQGSVLLVFSLLSFYLLVVQPPE